MTGQVRPVTSWMISAGPDARATGANAYVSAGAIRIRAVGACPSRLLPSVPRFRSMSSAPSPLLFLGALPSAASASVPLWPAITRTRMNPDSSGSSSPSPRSAEAELSRETAGEDDATFIVHRGKVNGIEEEEERKIEKEGALRSGARIRNYTAANLIFQPLPRSAIFMPTMHSASLSASHADGA